MSDITKQSTESPTEETPTSDITDLITATTELLESVNVSKETLDGSVTDSYKYSQDSKGYSEEGLELKNETIEIKNQTDDIKDEALADTTTIKNQAVSETTAIKDDAVSQTTTIKEETETIKNETIGIKDQAVTAKVESEKARDDTTAIAYEGEATLEPGPGKLAIADSEGYLDHEWMKPIGVPTPDFYLPLINDLTMHRVRAHLIRSTFLLLRMDLQWWICQFIKRILPELVKLPLLTNREF